MTEGYTKEDLKRMLKQMQETHHFYNVLDDLDTICTDDVHVFLDEDKNFMPDTVLHYCRKCNEITGFSAYNSGSQPSTYVLDTVINGLPMIMFRKIYVCGCGREFLSVTSVFEQVGYNAEYGFRPINYEQYYKKEN